MLSRGRELFLWTALVALLASSVVHGAEWHVWGENALLATADGVFRIDETEGEFRPFEIGGENVVRWSSDGEFGLALTESRLLYLLRSGGEPQRIPSPIEREGELPRLSVTEKHLVVLVGSSLYHRERLEADWRLVEVPRSAKEPLPGTRQPSDVCILGDELLLGFDNGEWGGALVSLSLVDGAVSRVAARTSRWVRDGRRVLRFARLSHLRTARVSIAERNGTGWETVVSVSSRDGDITISRNWPFRSTTIVDARPLGDHSGVAVLTQSGFAVFDGRSWTWTRGPWLRDPTASPERFLVRDDGKLLILVDTTPFEWNPRDGSYRRFSLAAG